ncbi:MAG: hypothetical protein CL793_07565 [Chloroflexi bacterium]|nr:hypothetical protein [Chloroflexota bacterium]|tara:strand:- start:2777 stop:3022 length:246 start_codon:yes stop_codon:yes gene_type:complete
MTDYLFVDIAGHLCELALVLGMFAIAKGFAAGWVLRIAGSVGWIFVAIVLAVEGVLLTSLMLWPLLFLAVDVYGLKSWTEE